MTSMRVISTVLVYQCARCGRGFGYCPTCGNRALLMQQNLIDAKTMKWQETIVCCACAARIYHCVGCGEHLMELSPVEPREGAS